MKKLSLFLFFLIAKDIYSQSVSTVFTSKSLVYYGLDFSHAQLIGDFGLGDPSTLKYKMTASWNDLVVREQKKFDLERTFRKREVFYDLAPITAQNEKINEATFHTFNFKFELNPQAIPGIVRGYDSGTHTQGLGLVFIVDRFDKNVEKAFVYVTFFDIATKEVYFSEMLSEYPSGIGLRNYWCGAISRILVSIKEHKYDSWQQKYFR